MNFDSSAALIIDHSSVPEKKSVFVLGSYAKRVTFLSQQNRALNLIWALFHCGKIKEGSRVAIVGAGLAGITAAVAAKFRKCKVTIYESSDEVMHIQRGNFTRYIHPNIYDWPREGSQEDSTNLPFLNWTADFTDRVVTEIKQDWEKYQQGIDIRTSQTVNNISEDASVPRVSVVAPFSEDAYDCVIVATGFGMETTMPFVPDHSYWSNDNLDQVVIAPKIPREFLVCGCGDGGLIDALRLSLKDFRHDKFTKEFLGEAIPAELRKKLIEIEDIIPSVTTDVSRFIYDAYKSLDIPPELLRKLKKAIRKDTKVKIVGKSPTPLVANASPLNRFAVFLLIKIEHIIYERLKVISAEPKEASYAITFENNEGENIKDDFDQVVLRRGPLPIVTKLVSRVANASFEIDQESSKRLWPNGFYPEKVVPPESQFQKAESEKFNLEERIRRSRSVTNFGIFISGGENHPVFLITYNGQLSKNLKKIKEWGGYPVVFTPTAPFLLSMSGSIRFTFDKKARARGVLAVGAPIANKQRNGGIGTLGCFVSLSNGMTGFLSTNHVLLGKYRFSEQTPNTENNEKDKIVVLDKHNNSHYEIGEVFSFIPMVYADNKPISVNQSDAAIGRLNSGVTFSANYRTGDKNFKITETADPAPDLTVFKLGAGSGLTRGRIIAISGRYTMVNEEKKMIFEDTFLIQGLGDEFSKPGDSGALVYDEQGIAYGIIVASSGIFTLVCPIKPILENLECRLFGNPT